MKTIMINAYANMINAGTITMDDIPQEYHQLVYEAMTNQQKPSDRIVSEAKSENILLYGALFLGKQEINVDVINQDGTPICDTFISTSSIFKGYLDDNMPTPEDIIYSVRLVENTFGKFEMVPRVLIESTSDGFRLQVDGTIVGDITTGMNILRIDISIESSNYEVMSKTIYLVAK